MRMEQHELASSLYSDIVTSVLVRGNSPYRRCTIAVKIANKIPSSLGNGRHSCGAGLYLSCKGTRRRFIFKFSFNGKKREMGLGSVRTISLSDARKLAAEFRTILLRGEDPIETRRAKRAISAPKKTVPSFGQCCQQFLKKSSWNNRKHSLQWRMTLSRYAAPLHSIPVEDLTSNDVARVLSSIWDRQATAMRLRGRISAVWEYARAAGHVPENRANPASWSILVHLLPKRKPPIKHFPAVNYKELPELMTRLQADNSIASLALQYLILTATRTNEVRGARWSEIDEAAAVWTIPSIRSKMSREHQVPLSSGALAILQRLDHETDLIFQLGQGAMFRLLKTISTASVHGMRSSFSQWARETTEYSYEVIEECLAHQTGSAVSRAYYRGGSLEKRAALMADWGRYLRGKLQCTI
jgi:integrase